MRLLNLPSEVLSLVESGDISAGHARALITSPDPVGLARQVMAKGLSVRETERLARTVAAPRDSKTPSGPEKDADTRRLESDLTAALGMRVRIDHKPETGGGSLSVSYRDLDQLDELCRRLSLSDIS
jgi:ParB family chromosome partitioning protein